MNEGTLEAIVRLISSVGFPIVVCGAMFWFINKTMEKFQVAISSMKEAVLEVKIAVEDMKQALIPATKSSEQILRKLEKSEV